MKLHEYLQKPKKHNLGILHPKKRTGIFRWPLMFRKVLGHSMMPVLPPNTLVVGLKYFHSLRIHDVIIFYHDGREKVKRIQIIDNGNLFVVGDHADASTDSRHFGWISTSNVIAKVIRPRKLSQEYDAN